MKKLDKQQTATLDELRGRYEEARKAIETAEEEANEQIRAINAKMTDLVNDLNAIIEEANTFREEIASDIENYIGEKSEKWQEGERGEAYNEWMSYWQNDVEEVDWTDIDEIERAEEIPEQLLNGDDYPVEPNS